MSKKTSKKSVQVPLTIDEYISSVDEEVRPVLQKIRETIRQAAPDAVETISYRMPAFKLHHVIAYFAAWKDHIGLYPPVKKDDPIYQEVAKFANDKGNLLFPLNQPIPYELIRQIVEQRYLQDSSTQGTKQTKKNSARIAPVKKQPVKKRSNTSTPKSSAKRSRKVIE